MTRASNSRGIFVACSIDSERCLKCCAWPAAHSHLAAVHYECQVLAVSSMAMMCFCEIVNKWNRDQIGMAAFFSLCLIWPAPKIICWKGRLDQHWPSPHLHASCVTARPLLCSSSLHEKQCPDLSVSSLYQRQEFQQRMDVSLQGFSASCTSGGHTGMAYSQ